MIIFSILLWLTWGQLHVCVGTARVEHTSETERSIRIEGNHFLLDGEQFRYVSGELHYFRAPHQYWRALLKKLRAAGLNAVSTYVEWSFHEPEERQYDWRGDRDLERFLELAAEENLLVLLRPGPYICAERDMGGLPYWLLSKYPAIHLRTTDQNFMKEVRIWFKVLFDKIQPHLYGNGGPIILVQVENEYGQFGCEKQYMEELKNMLKAHVQDAALLYTADVFTPNDIECGSVDGALTTINFNSDENATEILQYIRKTKGPYPFVNSEYYTGWYTKWGDPLATATTRSVLRGLRSMLQLRGSVNFYVFFGGTNFEFTTGSTIHREFKPVITSYDYDAPITEYGEVTDKYLAIRRVLQKIHPWAHSFTYMTRNRTTKHYWQIKLKSRLDILSKEGRALLGENVATLKGAKLPTFESRKQRAGLLLYETRALSGDSRVLTISMPRDRVYVFVDGTKVGQISRTDRNFEVFLNLRNGSIISLLVESQGRVYTGARLSDFKGILGDVLLDHTPLIGTWRVLSYPLQNLDISHEYNHMNASSHKLVNGPVLFSGNFLAEKGKIPQYIFLNPTGWGKGYAWINGRSLGRYWPLTGPQVTLYVPGVYLRPHPQRNLLQLLELEKSSTHIELTNYPI